MPTADRTATPSPVPAPPFDRFSERWLAAFSDRVNGDAEMQAIGRWFSVSLSLTCGDDRCIVRFERGRVAAATRAPRLDVPCAFGFRASPDIWQRFFSEPPVPLYHDVFAMLMRVPGFVLEGDTLVAMQHARALHRAMKIVRTVA